MALPRTVVTTIPQGYRITPDNKLFFATISVLEIPAGEMYADVEAECLTPGFAGMGFEIGEIRNMVDLAPFVASAVNITPTSGGADLEGLEAYRARLRMVPESFSVAGPDGAYEFWARTASPGIIDVKAWMPPVDLAAFAGYLQDFLASFGVQAAVTESHAAIWRGILNDLYRDSGTGPGNVNLAVLMQGGELPSQEIRDKVYAICNDRSIRPLTDFLHVIEPGAISYEIDLKYWIDRDDATYLLSIQMAVQTAVQGYIDWQCSALGIDINPDELQKRVKLVGVKRMVLPSPAFTVLHKWQIAVNTGVNVSYEGLEDI